MLLNNETLTYCQRSMFIATDQSKLDVTELILLSFLKCKVDSVYLGFR